MGVTVHVLVSGALGHPTLHDLHPACPPHKALPSPHLPSVEATPCPNTGSGPARGHAVGFPALSPCLTSSSVYFSDTSNLLYFSTKPTSKGGQIFFSSFFPCLNESQSDEL